MNNPATNRQSEPAASRVLTDLALVINQGLSVEDVLALIVEKAVATLGGTAGSVMMPGEGAGPMRVAAAMGRAAQGDGPDATGEADETSPEPPESHVAAWVMHNDQPVLLLGRTGPLAHLLHREDIRDAVCVPLRYAGLPIGALSVSNSTGRGPFQQSDVDLLTAIGHLAAVALQNTSLYSEAREHRERLQAVLHRLWSAQEEERRHLSVDLHDGPAQSLFHIVFLLQTARRHVENGSTEAGPCLEQAETAARATLAQLRGLMSGLRPMSLDDLGLVPTLRNECAVITARRRVAVDVRVTGMPRRLNDEAETALYRIAREALTNVERHAETEDAVVEVSFTPCDVMVRVEDWGKGFDANGAREARLAGRIGLEAVRERAESLGAVLEVASEIGRGTRVTVRYCDPAPAACADTLDIACEPFPSKGTAARGQARRKERVT